MTKKPVTSALVVALLATAPARAQRIFSPPQDVSQSADNSRLAAVAVQGPRSGPAPQTRRVFWQDFTSAPNLIWCAEDTGTGWSAGAACEPNVERGFSPRVLATASDGLHLVWRGRVAGVDDIWHAWNDGDSWSAPVNLSDSAEASANPTIGFADGGVWVLWEQRVGADVRFHQAFFDGAAWSAPTDSGLPYSGAGADSLRIAGGFGALHAVWADFDGAFQEIFHSQRLPGGDWSPPESLSQSPLEESVEPALALGGDGTLHVAWVEQDAIDGSIFEVVARRKPPWLAWEPVRMVSGQRASCFRPSIAAGIPDLGATPRIAWEAATATGADIYYQDRPGRPIQNLSQSPGVPSKRPSVALWGVAWPVVAWAEETAPGNYEILVSEGCADFEWNNCDGIDDDCNGLVDDGLTEVDCCDALDNDCDGDIDLSDSDCSASPGCLSPEFFACENGLDDDGDGLVDCADPDCCRWPVCDGVPESDCADGVDNDCDHLIDCRDSDCGGDPGCRESDCANGLDDDGDGLSDCDDSDCLLVGACADGDFDGDGVANGMDCAPTDPGAVAVPGEPLPLLVESGGADRILLAWPSMSAAGSGTSYSVAGAELATLPDRGRADAPCLVSELATPEWSESRPEAAFYYLVRAENACGPESAQGWGLDSGGAERAACP